MRASKLLVGDDGENARIEIDGASIKLINKAGSVRASLVAGPDLVSFKLFDEKGHCQAGLAVVKNGETTLMLGDEQPASAQLTKEGFVLWQAGNRRVEISASDEFPRFALRDSKGVTRAALRHLQSEDASSIPSLLLYDEKGTERLTLGGTVPTAGQRVGGADGLSWLLLRDAEKRVVWKAP